MKMIRIISLTSFLVSAMFAQHPNITLADAEELFARQRYTAVWEHYEGLLSKDSLNPELNYKVGVCYLNSRSQKEKAALYFKRAILSKQETVKLGNVYKLLGDASYEACNFREAFNYYELYEKTLAQQRVRDEAAITANSQKMEMCRMAAELKELKDQAYYAKAKTVPKKKRTDAALGSETLNALPLQTAPDLNFKKPFNLERTFHDKYFTDDYYSNFSGVSTAPKKRVRDTTIHTVETTVAASQDGQIILIYRNDDGNGNLYVSRLKGNEWNAIERLNKSVYNTGWEPGEFISADGNTLYFVSDREGGFGGKDIYKCVKTPNGNWDKAVNLGPTINTKYDEEAPYIHPDGAILYFSSNRFKPGTGFDNFKTILSDTGWSVPANVGYPVQKYNGRKGKEKKRDEKDNYRITFTEQQKIPVTMIKGKVTAEKGDVIPYVEITVTDNATGRVTGVYHPDSETGKYIFILPPGKNNNIVYEADGYLFYSENCDSIESFFSEHKTIELKPITKGSEVVLNNVFFKDNSADLDPISEIELNRLYEFLIKHPKVKIELSVTGKGNARLAEGRAEALVNYLKGKGIPGESVETKIYGQGRAKKRKEKESWDPRIGSGPRVKVVASN